MKPFKPLDFPPWLQWGQRRGALVPVRPNGPNGKRLCGWCPNEVPPGRRTRWCSTACSDAFGRVAGWGPISMYVKQRDRWTCQRCGTTNPPLPIAKPKKHVLLNGTEIVGVFNHRSDPWDVDHIVRVTDGGTDHPDNLRLLCIECHRLVGYVQRAGVRAWESANGDLFETGT